MAKNTMKEIDTILTIVRKAQLIMENFHKAKQRKTIAEKRKKGEDTGVNTLEVL